MIKKVYTRINIYPILDGYGDMSIFNSRTRLRVNRVLRNQLAGDVPSLVAYRLAEAATNNSRSSQPSGSLCCSRRWHFRKTSFKHRSVQIEGNFTNLTLHLYFKSIIYYAGLLFCSVYCQYSLPSIQSFKRS